MINAKCSFKYGTEEENKKFKFGGTPEGTVDIYDDRIEVFQKSMAVAVMFGAIGSAVQGKGKPAFTVQTTDVVSYNKIGIYHVFKLRDGKVFELCINGFSTKAAEAAVEAFKNRALSQAQPAYKAPEPQSAPQQTYKAPEPQPAPQPAYRAPEPQPAPQPAYRAPEPQPVPQPAPSAMKSTMSGTAHSDQMQGSKYVPLNHTHYEEPTPPAPSVIYAAPAPEAQPAPQKAPTWQGYEMTRCVHCGKDTVKAKFCTYCGLPLENACPKCHTVNPDEARFCFSCGNKLK